MKPFRESAAGLEMLLPNILGQTSDRGLIEAELEINWGFFSREQVR